MFLQAVEPLVFCLYQKLWPELKTSFVVEKARGKPTKLCSVIAPHQHLVRGVL
jgi:hypothetical protein